jgi:hypothetical protein|tara:strand:- start:572 stop:754 length:183 start_codon:yes stop_codon:yes gene_type:complete
MSSSVRSKMAEVTKAANKQPAIEVKDEAKQTVEKTSTIPASAEPKPKKATKNKTKIFKKV